MPDSPTRDEMSARLEATEARMETMVARIEGRLDSAVTRLEGKFDTVSAKVDQMAKESHALRWWFAGIIVTVLVTGIGTVVGVYGANASIVQSVLAGFQAGQQSVTPPKPSTP